MVVAAPALFERPIAAPSLLFVAKPLLIAAPLPLELPVTVPAPFVATPLLTAEPLLRGEVDPVTANCGALVFPALDALVCALAMGATPAATMTRVAASDDPISACVLSRVIMTCRMRRHLAHDRRRSIIEFARHRFHEVTGLCILGATRKLAIAHRLAAEMLRNVEPLGVGCEHGRYLLSRYSCCPYAFNDPVAVLYPRAVTTWGQQKPCHPIADGRARRLALIALHALEPNADESVATRRIKARGSVG